MPSLSPSQSNRHTHLESHPARCKTACMGLAGSGRWGCASVFALPSHKCCSRQPYRAVCLPNSVDGFFLNFPHSPFSLLTVFTPGFHCSISQPCSVVVKSHPLNRPMHTTGALTCHVGSSRCAPAHAAGCLGWTHRASGCPCSRRASCGSQSVEFGLCSSEHCPQSDSFL